MSIAADQLADALATILEAKNVPHSITRGLGWCSVEAQLVHKAEISNLLSSLMKRTGQVRLEDLSSAMQMRYRWR